MNEETSNELTHHGVKGMHWGVRKNEESDQASGINVESGIHDTTKKALVDVSDLVKDRYNYNLKNAKIIKPGSPGYPDVSAYVHLEPKQNVGTIFIQARDLSKDLKSSEKIGWFEKGTGNPKAFITHETAHSIFHAKKNVRTLRGTKTFNEHQKALDKAMEVALREIEKSGRSIWNISGYAKFSEVREELEAELFSQYHWATNPDNFIKAWGQTLHREMGIDGTPFKEMSHG